MKKTLAFAAVTAFGLSSAALADQTWDTDIVNDLGSFTLTGSAGGPVDTFEFHWTGLLVGFSFQGDYTDVNDAGMWASDTRLIVYLDGVEVYNLGGFSGVINPWDFQGSGSAADGFYAHGIDGTGPNANGEPDWNLKGMSGDWTFEFSNGWDSDLTDDILWENAVLTIHTIPAPGALALLGLAGLIGGRRRR